MWMLTKIKITSCCHNISLLSTTSAKRAKRIEKWVFKSIAEKFSFCFRRLRPNNNKYLPSISLALLRCKFPNTWERNSRMRVFTRHMQWTSEQQHKSRVRALKSTSLDNRRARIFFTSRNVSFAFECCCEHSLLWKLKFFRHVDLFIYLFRCIWRDHEKRAAAQKKVSSDDEMIKQQS